MNRTVPSLSHIDKMYYLNDDGKTLQEGYQEGEEELLVEFEVIKADTLKGYVKSTMMNKPIEGILIYSARENDGEIMLESIIKTTGKYGNFELNLNRRKVKYIVFNYVGFMPEVFKIEYIKK